MPHPRPDLSRSPGGFGLRRRARAFTLLEMIVVITIIAIIAGSLVPVITRPYVTERRLETVSEMGAIEEAIIGRYEYGDPGYVGTVGGLPANVAALVAQPSNVRAATTQPSGSPAVGVPFGWNGPYIKSEFEDPTLDAWGTAYQLNTNCSGHDPTTWSIQSAGPDRVMGTGDDFIFPSYVGQSTTTPPCFLSQGWVYVEIDEGYGAYTIPAPAQDLGTTTQVQLYYPQSPQNGGGNGLPTTVTCAVFPTGSTTSSVYSCPPANSTGSQLIPFGLPVVAVTTNNVNKFSSLASTTPQPYTWYQTVAHHRANTYQKVVIPVSAVTAATVQQPMAILSVSGNISSSGTPIGDLTGVPAQTQGTVLSATISGLMTMPNDSSTYCGVVPMENISGSWVPVPVPSTTPTSAPTSSTTLMADTQYGAWVQEAVTAQAYFTASTTVQLAAGQNPLIRFYGYAFGSGSCSFVTSSVKGYYNQAYSTP